MLPLYIVMIVIWSLASIAVVVVSIQDKKIDYLGIITLGCSLLMLVLSIFQLNQLNS